MKPTEYVQVKHALDADLGDATVVQITDEVLIASVRLLESHPLRASDAIQVASALVWGADQFISADTRQCAAGKTEGLSVVLL